MLVILFIILILLSYYYYNLKENFNTKNIPNISIENIINKYSAINHKKH